MPTLIVQKWEESERGWGCRPDGYSLHLTEEDRVAYIKAYWDSMPDQAPSEYERPDGTPYLWDADAATAKKVRATKNGLRCTGEPPGSGGVDGWLTPKRA